MFRLCLNDIFEVDKAARLRVGKGSFPQKLETHPNNNQ